MSFKVMAEQCDECLFSKDKIVDNQRRKQIIETCLREDRHFICHKATIAGRQDVCCRAFYEQLGLQINLIRIAQRLHVVEEVTLEQLESI